MITTAIVTSLHNIHYIGLVKLFSENRNQEMSDVRGLGRRDVVLAYIYSFGIHGIFLMSALMGQVVLASLVSLHYVVDGKIWRLREDPMLPRYLNLGRATSEATRSG